MHDVAKVAFESGLYVLKGQSTTRPAVHLWQRTNGVRQQEWSKGRPEDGHEQFNAYHFPRGQEKGTSICAWARCGACDTTNTVVFITLPIVLARVVSLTALTACSREVMFMMKPVPFVVAIVNCASPGRVTVKGRQAAVKRGQAAVKRGQAAVKQFSPSLAPSPPPPPA